ncbi:DUF551 domain-containing protein [Klebsiella pneumoniae]
MPPAQPVADSEPVAWTWQHLKQWHVTNDEERARDLAWDGVKVEPLYRHAQPVPVVSAELLHTAASAIEDLLTTKDRTGAGVWFDLPFRLRSAANAQPALVVPDEIKHRIGGLDWGWEGEFNRGWNAFRAAMRQELKKSAGTEAICRSDENVQVLHTKSPAQSDCCPAQNQGWIPVSERMPEDEQEVLTINKMGHRFVSFFDKHSGLFFDRLDAPAACCIEHVLVTHWMPLPAAPQEVR